jgi:type VI secretion system FHA domain protein
VILTLEVMGPREGTPRGEDRKVFKAAGGTIGRLPDNDWVLTDPFVSSRHARIRYANGVFQIEDTSTNGVFINSPDNRLVRGQPHTLQSGDRIFIDPYEIRASVTSEPADVADPFRIDDAFGEPLHSAPLLSVPSDPLPRPSSSPLRTGEEEVDPLRALGFHPDSAPVPNVPRASDLAASSLLSEHYQAPAPVPSEPPPSQTPGLIPDDYDPLRPDQSGPVEVPSSARRAAAPSRSLADAESPRQAPHSHAASPGRSGPRQAKSAAAAPSDAILQALLEGAGLDASAVTPEFAKNFGQILRVVVVGVMDVLQARQRIKDEFRMRVTTFKASQNNPLKFSANVEDALHNLLVKRNPAYLGPVAAFEDAFDDIRNHQMAMLAGVRAAFEAMLSEFHPDRLQEEFNRQGKGSLLAGPGKLRYWDQYRAKFSDMVSDADARFRELFGDEFAKAYEEQLERLKGRDRPGTP